jgi:hypothetical protein
MIVTRLVSLILRAAQFVFAAIVLGLTAYFLHQRLSHGLTFPPASLTTLTPPTSLHSRLGRRLRRAGALLQHAELRQRVGVDGLQSAPQQRVRAVEGCAGLLVPVAGRVVCDFCAGCHYVPPSQPPARRQRGPW